MGAVDRYWEHMKQVKEDEKQHGKAGNAEGKGWGWSWKKMNSLYWKTGWEISFVKKILKG